MLADRAQAQAPGRAEEEPPAHDHEHERDVDHEVEPADDVADQRHVLEEVQDGRDARDVAGAAGAEDRVRAVARDAEPEDVDRGARDDLVGAQVDREHGVDEAEERRPRPSRRAARSPTSRSPATRTTPQKQPISIMPSRPMLMTPERSEKRPPSAPNVSGVAYWNAPTKRPGRDDRGHVGGSACATAMTSSTKSDERGEADLRAARHSGVTRGRRTAPRLAARRRPAACGSSRARAWRARPASARSARRRRAG